MCSDHHLWVKVLDGIGHGGQGIYFLNPVDHNVFGLIGNLFTDQTDDLSGF